MKTLQQQTEAIKKLIQAKRELIADQAKPGGLRGSIDTRVGQGLENLERIIGIIRESILITRVLDRLSFQPELQTAIQAEASKIRETDFFNSFRKQLDEQEQK